MQLKDHAINGFPTYNAFPWHFGENKKIYDYKENFNILNYKTTNKAINPNHIYMAMVTSLCRRSSFSDQLCLFVTVLTI